MTPLCGGMQPEESVASSRSGPFPGQLDAMTDIVTPKPGLIPLSGLPLQELASGLSHPIPPFGFTLVLCS